MNYKRKHILGAAALVSLAALVGATVAYRVQEGRIRAREKERKEYVKELAERQRQQRRKWMEDAIEASAGAMQRYSRKDTVRGGIPQKDMTKKRTNGHERKNTGTAERQE